jgi:NADH:ubiquinone oxidoreductase subunit
MGLLKRIFTWWDGATLGTALQVRMRGTRVGSDMLGNIYYGTKEGRRWIIYAGANDPGLIPPEWYSWLHHQIDAVPDEALPPPPKFLREPTGNRTGTPEAYRPAGAMERGGVRQAASGDYEAWTPGQG